MIFDLVLIGVALAILAIGSFTDIRTREVPDWVSYSGIAAGFGLRMLYTSYYLDWSFIIEGILGFFVFTGIALAMFYLGQWGGGDSKVMMAIGAILGLQIRPDGMLLSFFTNMLFIGALYGILWGIFLALSHRKDFMKNANAIVSSKKYKSAKKALFVFAASLLVLSGIASFWLGIPSLALLFVSSILLVLMIFYSWLFLMSVEKTSLLKMVPVEKLTEGDWIVKDVIVKGKRICGPKDLGISRQQIAQLLELKNAGAIEKVMIKEGMPFVPVFLISLIITLAFGNVVLAVML